MKIEMGDYFFAGGEGGGGGCMRDGDVQSVTKFMKREREKERETGDKIGGSQNYVKYLETEEEEEFDEDPPPSSQKKERRGRFRLPRKRFSHLDLSLCLFLSLP